MNNGIIDGQPRGNNIYKPTEQKALRLRTTRSILVLERRLRYIENVISRLDDDEKEIFKIIFKYRYSQKNAETYKYISADTYYNVYRKVIYYTAVEFGEI